jgi:mono/diheme cytochrome c family protein
LRYLAFIWYFMRSFAALFPVFAGLTPLAAAPAALDFQRDVRPVLSNHCFHCHGPDEEGRKGDLRLDHREEALAALSPGKPEESEVVKRIFAHDEDDLMPPPSAKKPMTAAQKDLLKRWVAEGAVYSKHWAFEKPQPPAPPQIRAAAARIVNPIDAFVVARLEQEGLRQSSPADASTLARRVALDLTGLPPTPEELRAFVNDSSPDAYEAFVDRLLKSPHYGERWARRWLDIARYADTNGYEKDRARSIWPYRDWVIQALNADMPFDQFTIEQIAGDMLPNATSSQIIATGFHRNTMLNEEGGIDPLEFRFNAMTDRVATTGAAWLGLTLGCAQCHTHKFDPISHNEYYSLMAFLNNTDEPDYDLPDPEAKGQRERNEMRAEELLRALIAKNRESERAAFEAWVKEKRAAAAPWRTLRPARISTNLPLLTIQPDGSVLGSGDITKSDRYDLSFPAPDETITAIRLEALPHESLPAHGPGMCYYEGPKGDFFMGEFQVMGDGQPVKIASATESYAKNNFGKTAVSAAAATDGDPQTGWSCAGRYGEAHEAVFVFEKPIRAKDLKVTMLFGRHYACPLGHFRISVTSGGTQPKATGLDPALAAQLYEPEATTSDGLFAHYLLTSEKFAKEAQPILNLRKPVQSTTTLVMRERPSTNRRPTHRHHRGEFTQPKELVQPAALSALHAFPEGAAKDRLGFARWLVAPENPLTARVVANRQWAVFFGRGLVKTVDDFGYQGAPPSHPELLDYLATEFVRQGWSLKRLHKLIVMSATYRQSSVVKAEALERDPENILLSRFPRQRLDAELVRDSALRASGLLTAKVGGPSVYPPQPDSVTEAAYGNFKWTPSTGSDRYRRSLYTFSKRTAPFAMFTTFDGPTGEACVVKRETSNTALQALTSLNDIIITEAAQALGRSLAAQSETDTGRIRSLYLRTLSRLPDHEEERLMLKFTSEQRRRLAGGELQAGVIAGSEGPDAAESAVWSLAARALFNVDEFVTKG